MLSTDEIIFEFYPVQNSVRVTAFHVSTLTEVVLIAPNHLARADMERAATQKLNYVLRKAQQPEQT